jgi:hypothetical protein
MQGKTVPPYVVRSPQEVARRALGVFSVVGLALGAPKNEVVEWLQEQQLFETLTSSERRFIDAAKPSEQARINAGWLSERLIVLCWALCHVEQLPATDEQCDTGELQGNLPPFAETSVEDFIGRSTVRPDRQLLEMADTLHGWYREAEDRKTTGAPGQMPVDIEILQERCYAINWLIGFDDVPWYETNT